MRILLQRAAGHALPLRPPTLSSFSTKAAVLHGREHRDEVVGLKYVADVPQPQVRQPVAVQPVDALTLELHLPVGGMVQPAHEVGQGALAAAGGRMLA